MKTSEKKTATATKIKALSKANSEKKTASKAKSKTPKVSKKKLDKINAAKVTQEVVSNRELKWIYPAEVVNTLDRKAFRQKMRNQIRRMERAIAKLEGKAKVKEVKSLKTFKATVLYKPTTV